MLFNILNNWIIIYIDRFHFRHIFIRDKYALMSLEKLIPTEYAALYIPYSIEYLMKGVTYSTEYITRVIYTICDIYAFALVRISSPQSLYCAYLQSDRACYWTI